MTSLLEDVPNNSSLIETIYQFFGNLSITLLQLLGLGTDTHPLLDSPQVVLNDFKTSSFVTVFTDFLEWFAFDEFQLKLLKGFLLVLACNFLLICVAWSFYGQNISDKFMRPATSKAIQDLKKSVSQLKLPSEHTPRI